MDSEAPGSPLVTVVVCARNSEATIEGCLRSMRGQTMRRMELLVVDGVSSDGTVKVARRYADRVLSDGGRGLGYARDLGWRSARGRIVVYIDADQYAPPAWLETLIQPILQDPSVAGVQSRTLVDPERARRSMAARSVDYTYRVFYERAGLWWYSIGCTGSAFRRDVLERVGGFSPRFRVANEDGYISLAIRRAGYRLRFNPGAANYHLERTAWSALWRKYYWWGYYYRTLRLSYPGERALNPYRFLPPLAFASGVRSALTIVSRYRDLRGALAYPFAYTFARAAWCWGYLSNRLDAAKPLRGGAA